MDLFNLVALWFSVALGLLACLGWWVEMRLRAQMSQGAFVTIWYRPRPVPPGADSFYFHLRTTRGDLLLTEEAFAVARDRAEKLLERRRHHA